MRLLRRSPDLVIPYQFRRPPYGGSNQFLTAFRDELRRRGLRVSDGAFGRFTRACLLHSYLVDVDRLSRAIPDGCRVVHRVDGPIQLYRGTDDGADHEIVRINSSLADATVFQSRWSLEAHRELGIELRNPVVIHNAVDPSIFHPPLERSSGRRLRVIATSWSDNPRKGAAMVAALAQATDPARFEFTFIGRTQAPLDGVRQVEPLGSRSLAQELRMHDVYLAPSVNEPCSNALLEALSCGLPVLYRRSGSHAELVGAAGLGFEGDGDAASQLERLAHDLDEHRGMIRAPRLAEVADQYIEVLGL
jgi:glycosyltransferase involved in cell wall biosynthesis